MERAARAEREKRRMPCHVTRDRFAFHSALPRVLPIDQSRVIPVYHGCEYVGMSRTCSVTRLPYGRKGLCLTGAHGKASTVTSLHTHLRIGRPRTTLHSQSRLFRVLPLLPAFPTTRFRNISQRKKNNKKERHLRVMKTSAPRTCPSLRKSNGAGERGVPESVVGGRSVQRARKRCRRGLTNTRSAMYIRSPKPDDRPSSPVHVRGFVCWGNKTDGLFRRNGSGSPR